MAGTRRFEEVRWIKDLSIFLTNSHAPLDRRVFKKRLAVLTGSTVAAEAALQLLAPNYALAAIVAENDPRVETVVSTDAASGLKTYTAVPKATKDAAAKSLVIVVYENRGLNPHIRDIARRLAIAGFKGIAVDMLTPMGGTPADEDQARDMFPKLDRTKGITSLVAMIDDRKKKDPGIKIGVLGFCWGGSVVNALAAAAPNLDAAIVFYGVSPKPEAAAKMLLHYAGLDKRINDTVPPFEEALKMARVKYEMFPTTMSITPSTTTQRKNTMRRLRLERRALN